MATYVFHISSYSWRVARSRFRMARELMMPMMPPVMPTIPPIVLTIFGASSSQSVVIPASAFDLSLSSSHRNVI